MLPFLYLRPAKTCYISTNRQLIPEPVTGVSGPPWTTVASLETLCV